MIEDRDQFAYDCGQAAVLLKQAGDAELSYSLKGKLYLSKSGWLLMQVPNAMGIGAFRALNEPGAELPLEDNGKYNAHVSVMRPEDIEQIGGPGKLVERGKDFSFTLGPVRAVNPAGWDAVSKCWFIEIHSPELERLRKSYGLTALPKDNEFQFHCTFAIRQKKVLQENDLSVHRQGSSIHQLGWEISKLAATQEKTALHPAAIGALLGSGLGAGVGYLTAPKDKAGKRQDILYSLLSGGLNGGLLGGAAGGLLNLSHAKAMARDTGNRSEAPERDDRSSAPDTGGRPYTLQTLRGHVGKYYSGATGGLGRAVELAQQWQQRLGDTSAQSWKPSDLDLPSAVVETGRTVDGAGGVIHANSTAYAQGQPPVIDLHDSPQKQKILEHELTHGAFSGISSLSKLRRYGTTPGEPVVPSWMIPGLDRAVLASGRSTRDHWDYMMAPDELQAWMAMVKRRYVKAHGRHIDTPEEAERALNWHSSAHPKEGVNILYEYGRDNPKVRSTLIEALLKVVKGNASATDKTAAAPIKVPLPKPEQETMYTCGPAALESIEKGYGKETSEKALADKSEAGPTKGTEPKDLVATAAKDGFRVNMHVGMEPEQLMAVLDTGHPVIVSIQAWGDGPNKEEKYQQLKDGHYVIAVGYDDQNVYFQDPAIHDGSKGSLPWDEFMGRWHDREFHGEVYHHLGIEVWKEDAVKPTEQPAGEVKKIAAAPGIPDRDEYGDLSQLSPGQMLTRVVQRHRAMRAGPHYDVRLGDPKLGLFSWATKGEEPRPGERRFMTRQPLHNFGWKNYQGEIPKGKYGAGSVEKVKEDRVLVTKVEPDAIHFTTADAQQPERFVLLSPKKWGGNEWLIVNSTPQENLPYQKIHYKKVPAAQVEQIFAKMKPGTSVQAKVDGASSLVKLLADGVEVTSYRASKRNGQPIVHTERVFGGRPQAQIPKEYVGSVLRGELYGALHDGPERNRGNAALAARGAATDAAGASAPGLAAGPGAAGQRNKRVQLFGGLRTIPPQQLGGILNATIANSLAKQKEHGVELKDMLFDIQRLGRREIDLNKTPYAERHQMLESVLPHLPAGKFHLPPEAKTPEEASALWRQITTGQHPLTREGVVIHPPTGQPMKAKALEESDVHVTDVFPGTGRLAGTAAGGFAYALEPGGTTVGKVGTGLSDELRRELWSDPASFVGRVARIRSQGQHVSGAHRAPSLISFHEDYPEAPVEKQAEHSFTMDAARNYTNSMFNRGPNSPTLWDPNAGIMGNIQRHFGAIRGQAQQNVNTVDANRRLQFTMQRMNQEQIMRKALSDWRKRGPFNPASRTWHKAMGGALDYSMNNAKTDLATQDFLNYLHTGRDPIVNSPIDKAVLQGQLPVGDMLFGQGNQS